MKFPQLCYQFKDLLAFQSPNLSLVRIKTNLGSEVLLGPDDDIEFLKHLLRNLKDKKKCSWRRQAVL